MWGCFLATTYAGCRKCDRNGRKTQIGKPGKRTEGKVRRRGGWAGMVRVRVWLERVREESTGRGKRKGREKEANRGRESRQERGQRGRGPGLSGARSVEQKQSEKGCARASADLRIDEVEDSRRNEERGGETAREQEARVLDFEEGEREGRELASEEVKAGRKGGSFHGRISKWSVLSSERSNGDAGERWNGISTWINLDVEQVDKRTSGVDIKFFDEVAEEKGSDRNDFWLQFGRELQRRGRS